MKRWLVAPYLVGMLLLGGCDSLPSVPTSLPPLPANPFAATPALLADVPTPAVSPTPIQISTPVPFAAYWVKNHRQTEMWSGPAGQSGVITFGTTSTQFCVFQVVRPQDGARLYVLNPLDRNYFWIDADAVGPAPTEPRRAAGPKPADTNCTDEMYDP